MVENSINYYETYKNVLIPKLGGVDLRFFEKGNIAVCGVFLETIEMIAVVKRKNKFSYISSTEFGKTNFLKIKTRELADFLEINLKYSLDKEENPDNIIAFLPDFRTVYDF